MGGPLSSWKHTLGGVATFGLVALLHPHVSVAASLAVPRVMGPTFGGQIHRVFFHGHSGRGISYYCYPRNYWWFYRPYTTANDGYARLHAVLPLPAASLSGRWRNEIEISLNYRFLANSLRHLTAGR
jgi:hypothetical protein